jgi:thiopeptide-type bacteriocin biosynthesis protein
MAMTVKRRFIFGEEWLYLKIYSGPKMLEEILINDLYPVVRYLYSAGMTDKFFFVRYFDEGYHLRLRFRITDLSRQQEVFNLLSEKLKSYSDNRILAKTIIDTYNREIERYGSKTIEQVESVFSINSWEILHVLSYESDYHNRWLCAIKIMDNLLDRFGVTVNEKYNLYQSAYLALLREFGDEKYLKENLKKKYREHAKKISDTMNSKYIIPPIPYPVQNEDKTDSEIKYILELKKKELLEISFESLLINIMHMHYNRVFRVKHRLHELVIYYMMSNYYKSSQIKDINQNPLFLF